MRGGKREGAGAPKLLPLDAKRRQIYLTDDEYEKVKEYIKQLRSEGKMTLEETRDYLYEGFIREKDIAGLNEVTASQKTTIEEQDSQLNVVWFCIADMKQLKEARIVEGNGLFKTKSIMDGDFDKSAFTSADLRNLTRIETGSKKPKLLTSHPKESYTLTPGEDKLVTLEITDPAKFWSISKYLVIRK